MTQPHPDAGFGVRPSALLEPAGLPPFRLPYDDVLSFAERRLRDDVAPELTVDVFARLDRGIAAGETWCWLTSDIAALADAQLTAQHFAHGVGPSAHEAIDAPYAYARQCVYVYRLGLWLTERRPGEGYVACLLRHEAAPERGQAPVGHAAELVEFRAARRPKPDPVQAELLAEPAPAVHPSCPKCGTDMTTSGGRTPLRCISASCRYEPAVTPVGSYLPPEVARSVTLSDAPVCGWQRGSDDSPCSKKPHHEEPHRVRSPYGDGRWTDYDVAAGLEVARSLAWTAELRQVDGPLAPMQVRDGDRAWVRGVLAYGRPEVVWIRCDDTEDSASADTVLRWVDVFAAAGDEGGATLEAYAADKAAEKGQPWVGDEPGDTRHGYVVRPTEGGAELLRRPLPEGVRRGRGAAAGEPYDYVVEADPGLEGLPGVNDLPFDGIATEVAQAIGSSPAVQRSWLPGDNLRPLVDVIRVRLADELEKRGLVDDDQLQRALAVLGTVETVKATRSRAEIAGVSVEPCDDYGRTRSTAIAPPISPAGRKVADLLGEMVNSGVGFDPQVLADAVIDAFDAFDGDPWVRRRPWLEPFVRFVEASDDAPLNFDGNTAPPRLQRILEAAYGDGIEHLLGHDCARPEAHTDATPGDTAVILDDDVDLAPGASAAATAVGAELARQLGRPRDEAGHRHFDAQALAAAALQAIGVGERPADRRMLLVAGQTIRTADGEEVVAMCSERSWARLLVDAWHTFPVVDDPDEAVASSTTALTLAGALADAFEGRALDELLWQEMAATALAWVRDHDETWPTRAAMAGMVRAADGGLVPADVGWTPPLIAENARVLEGRGIDIVGAPIASPLCVCGHERAMHAASPFERRGGACSVLSSVPYHDCSAYERALPATDPAAAEVAPQPHNGQAPPPGFRADGHEERCEASEQEACGCLEALVEALSVRGVIYGQAMILRSLALYARRSTGEAARAAMEGGWEPSDALVQRLLELGLA